MLFGLCNVPADWQYFINNVLKEYLNIFVIVYINNILIYNENKADYKKHV